MLMLRLSGRSSAPAYVQLAQQVRQALMAGELKPGDQLPTIKDVVAELAINPNTVLKAYRELERDGLVEGRQGVGTFAVRRPAGPSPAQQAALTRSLTKWVTAARDAGFDDAAMEGLLRSCLLAGGEARTA
jgi:GntR family transcriptional regulator